MNWLDHSKTLREQGVDESEHLLLRRKFFFSDQNVDARDPVQLNLLYVQVSAPPPSPSNLARARREALGSHSPASLTCIRGAGPACVDCKSLSTAASSQQVRDAVRATQSSCAAHRVAIDLQFLFEYDEWRRSLSAAQGGRGGFLTQLVASYGDLLSTEPRKHLLLQTTPSGFSLRVADCLHRLDAPCRCNSRIALISLTSSVIVSGRSHLPSL